MRFPSFKAAAIITLVIWLSLALLVVFNSQPIVDNFVSLAQIIFYVASLLMIKSVYKGCNTTARHVLIVLLAAILIAIVTDSINYCILFILKHVNFFIHDKNQFTLSRLDNILHVADYIEIFIWYLIIFFFLLNLLKTFFIRQSRYQMQFIIFAACLVLVLISLLYLSQPEKLIHANFFTLIAFISSIIEIATFIVAIYGLIHSKSWSLYLLLSSMIVMAVTQISALFYYSYHIQEFLKLAYITGPLWVMMVFLAFYYMKVKQDYNLEKWFVTPDTLEARLAFSTLAITCSSFIIFFILASALSLLNEQKFLSFFLFLMIYSLVAVLAAKSIASSFAKPFQQLQINMGNLMAAQSIPDKPTQFEIAEFDFLQNFIYERFAEHEAQNEKIKAMGKMAIQVAHDIRSPAAAIMMLAKDSENLPEDQRVSLRSAATRVQDIANNILTDSQQSHLPLKNANLMLAPTIMSVISEKRTQYHDRLLKISLSIDQPAYFAHVNLHPIEFKCVLSNLINNAVEAINNEKSGEVNIAVNVENNVVHIIIHDNGHGINPMLLEKLNNGKQIQSTKKAGLGLGLQHAKKFMEDEKGTIIFESCTQKGTTITLTFELANMPCWLADKISFSINEHIVILDDDQAIHGAWDQRFAAWIEEHPTITVKHFHSGTDCLDYILSLDQDERRNVLFLSDYELINQDMTGLDVIEQSGIGQAILVTSYYDHQDIIKRSILVNAKILPKMLASEVILSRVSSEKKIIKKVDGILLDDQTDLSEIIQFLAKNHQATLDIYSDPYQLWENLICYSHDTALFLDYDLGLPVNGIDIAERLHVMGYKALYLATGFQMKQEETPTYLTVLPDKMTLLNFMK